VTSEFWLKLAALGGSVAAMLVTMNVIHTSDQNALTQTITQVILGIGTIWGLVHASNNYANNRTDLKAAALKASAKQPVTTTDLRTR
jgi:hypothetical protein